ANPLLSNRDVQEILAYSARQVGAPASYQTNHAFDWNGGGLHTSTDFGYGLVDALAAVRMAEIWTPHSNWSAGFAGTVSPGLAIPDSNTAGVNSTFSVIGGSNYRLLRIDIDLNVTHTWIGDLVVTLTSPGGTVSTLVNRPGKGPSSSSPVNGSNQDNINFVLDSTQFWGEKDSVGTWTLNVSDRSPGDTGTLNGYTWRVYD